MQCCHHGRCLCHFYCLTCLALGDLQKHKIAIKQFYNLLKPGGILFVDHRNYDSILDLGVVPHGPNVYYQVITVHYIVCKYVIMHMHYAYYACAVTKE